MKKLFHVAMALMILFSLVNCKFLGLEKEEETTTTEPFRPTGGGGGSDDTSTNLINTSVRMVLCVEEFFHQHYIHHNFAI